MIYLITGTPGAGKTLYAVSTLVQDLLKQKPVKDGKVIERRLVVDGVPDLVIPHDLLAPVEEDEKGKQFSEGDSVLNWPDWCRPGDIIFIDEVQRVWRPRGMGVKPPECIKALETHRHKGVDFVIVTQNPMLIDQNVRRLVGRHQHIRRILGMKRAAVYEWDGCSVNLNVRQATSTSHFGYPKSAYSLYKSSELHTQQKFKIPAWAIVPVLGIVGAIFVGPKAVATVLDSARGKGVQQTHKQPDKQPDTLQAQKPLEQAKSPVVEPISPSPQDSSSAPASAPPDDVAGCIVVGPRCSCFTTQGKKVVMSADYCAENSASQVLVPKQVQAEPIERSISQQIQDAEALKFMHVKT